MITVVLRLILICGLAGSLRIGFAQAPTTDASNGQRGTGKQAEPQLQWHDVTQWGVEGRGWPDLERVGWFDRLPAIAQGKVTDAVWELSRDTAGMMVRFKTDAATLWTDYTMRNDRGTGTLSFRMGGGVSAVGGAGLDLYARDDAGKWRWVTSVRPADRKVIRQAIIADLAPGFREYAVYLPLYNGVENLSFGVPPSARFERLAPRSDKPVVFYGTSIVHGVGASRPGMAHPAILGRRLDVPTINLGFAGNGRMDAAVADLLVKIEAAAYVIDCLPNMNGASVREKCIPFVKQLRAARPDTPIILVEDRRYPNTWIQPKRAQANDENHAALRECFAALQREGVKGLFYVPGDELLGHDGESSTDGIHPNDVGFMRHADVFEPILRLALGRTK